MDTLRKLLAQEEPLLAPSVYDGMTALLAKEAGFKTVYIGSYDTTATRYGIPDTGFLGLSEMVDQVRRISDTVAVPIVVDGEDGWGNPIHVARAVRQLERAGAAATHIEDHEFGKHITFEPRVVRPGVVVDKIKAAVDARNSEEFMIIARSDAQGSEGGAAVVDRLLTYEQAGADALFVAGILSDEEWKQLYDDSSVPLISVELPWMSAGDFAARGVSMVIYYGVTHLAAAAGVRSAYKALVDTGSLSSVEHLWGGVDGLLAFDDFLGVAEVREAAGRYGLLP